MSSPEPQSRGRRFYQFSLRTLLVVVTLAAGCAFAWRTCVEPYRLQRDAMAAIAKLGGTYKAEDATGWIRYLDKNSQDVVTVDLADCDQPADYLPHLAQLPKLKTLVVGGHEFGDEQLTALRRARSLRALVLDSTKVSDEAVEHIKQDLPEVAVYQSERRAIAALKKLNVGVADYDALESAGRRHPRIAFQANRPQPLCSEIGDGYFVEPVTCAGIFRGRSYGRRTRVVHQPCQSWNDLLIRDTTPR